MLDLPKRQLGRTGLEVTTLGYGAMEIRNLPGRESTEEQAERILNAVLDAGVNYIDTSIDYGDSEERIGRYISQRAPSTTSLRSAAARSERQPTARALRTSSPRRTSSPASSRACDA